MSELVMEIEFFYRAPPALRGEIKIGLTKNYLDAKRSDEPDWFYKGDEVYYESNIQGWPKDLQDHCNRVTNDQLLAIYWYADGNSGTLHGSKC
jgi:hypothetical protein